MTVAQRGGLKVELFSQVDKIIPQIWISNMFLRSRGPIDILEKELELDQRSQQKKTKNRQRGKESTEEIIKKNLISNKDIGKVAEFCPRLKHSMVA